MQQNQQPNNGSDRAALRQIRLALIAAVVALVALVAIPTYAWLSNQKTLKTVTEVNVPNELRIGAGHLQAVTELDLSNINVSGSAQSFDLVFCVHSNETSFRPYILQLAHTTNIGFTYTIYPATKDNSGPHTFTYLGNNYSFDPNGASLSGSYLNQDEQDSTIADPTDPCHDKTYAALSGTGVYGEVHQNAEPLYWKSGTVTPQSSNQIDYYVLHISWDSTVQNDKETDLVYLMAESVGS